MPFTLYVAISAHGYGHIAQTAPVVNELCRRNPDLRIVIECAAARSVLEKRFDVPFEHVPVSTDFGMVMKNALEVDNAASHARYVELHAHLDEEVEASLRRMLEHDADVLLANIPYVPLIAAARLGLPSVALCSLNWAAIYGGVCRGMEGADRIHDDMVAAYRLADCFLAPEPSMAMSELSELSHVGPIANVASAGTRKSSTVKRVVVTMGGIDTQLDFARWPRIAGVTWAVPDAVDIQRDDMMRHSDFDGSFVDLMSSRDALITKPGYGAFVEAACNAVPVVYVPRVDWPEAPYLVRWLETHGNCAEIGTSDLHTARLEGVLTELWAQPCRERVEPTGISEAADEIERVIGNRDARHRLGAGG